MQWTQRNNMGLTTVVLLLTCGVWVAAGVPSPPQLPEQQRTAVAVGKVSVVV